MKEFTKYNRKGLLKKILLRLIIAKSKYLITVSENQKKMISDILNQYLNFLKNGTIKVLDFDKIKKYNLHGKMGFV